MAERRCPTCGRPAALRVAGQPGPFPFCSERCRQVDLGRWFSEQYAVPAVEEEPPDREPRE
jgi:endogenous inhibitor of DNA gyrase (YacG/DUF329 family)